MLAAVAAGQPSVKIDLSRQGAEIPASLYGVFFEEISGAGDGGLYAEMVRNRGFEEGVPPSGTALDEHWRANAPASHCYSNDSINHFGVDWGSDRAMTAWSTQYADRSQARSSITDTNPLNDATPHSLYIDLSATNRPVHAVNHGYWGMGFEQGKTYNGEFYASAKGTPRCTVEAVDADGRVISRQKVQLIQDGEWHRYAFTLTPDATTTRGELHLVFEPRGEVWLDFVSLFPADTFRGRPGGLRRDVASAIEELHPAFMRWPGGCIVEGLTLENRVKWKETIGPAVSRPGEYDLWGYRNSYGFGYHEFLQLCEDIGAEGMFVCNAGMSCLFRNGDYVQGPELESLIQDALDAIEYALGDTTTTWGAERARNGHPEPFPLKYVEVGNENVFSRYAENYNRFHRAIKERYPEVTLITALMFSDDLKRLDDVEVIDPHYYETADWFYNNADVYDRLSRRTPYKVYIGEYAATGRSNIYSSLAEAAFLTGCERNADKIQLVSYAPLLQNSHYGHGHLIICDNLNTYGRSNYHILKLFARNRPDVNVDTRIAGEAVKTPRTPRGRVGLATVNSAAEFADFRITSRGNNYSTDWTDLADRWTTLRGQWEAGEGTLRQPNAGEAMIVLDDADFADCTITLKARKTDGGEGFRVIFGLTDADTYFMADFGSHGNESVIFREINPEKGSVSLFDYRNQLPIQKGHWYDVRVEIRGNKWKCWLDGKLAYSYDYYDVNKHYAVSGIDRAANELVVKLVNATDEPWTTELDVTGGRLAAGEAGGWVVSGPDLTAENSFADPELVSARPTAVTVAGRRVPVTCAPASVTLLRLPLD